MYGKITPILLFPISVRKGANNEWLLAFLVT